MTKKRLLQLGVIGALVIVLAVVGVIKYHGGKFFGKAETLGVAPLNLQAVLPSVADDMAQNHWAQNYVDAVTQAKYGPGKNEALISLSQPDSNGLVTFRPDVPLSNELLAIYLLRLKGLSPTACSGKIYKDINSASWGPFCADIELAYQLGFFKGTVFSPGASSGYFNPGSQFNVSIFKQILTNAGYTTNTPTGFPCDDTCNPTTRAHAAAYFAFNANLPGESPYPSVYLQWNFPSDPKAGFDLGYEVWRLDPGASEYNLQYTQDPPAEGMEEGSDLGMFYDKSVAPGQTYTYKVLLMNRAGDYSAPDQVSIEVP